IDNVHDPDSDGLGYRRCLFSDRRYAERTTDRNVGHDGRPWKCQNRHCCFYCRRTLRRICKMPPKNTDSIISAQERAAKIREESAQIEREQAEAAEKQRAQQAVQRAAAQQQEARNIELVSS